MDGPLGFPSVLKSISTMPQLSRLVLEYFTEKENRKAHPFQNKNDSWATGKGVIFETSNDEY